MFAPCSSMTSAAIIRSARREGIELSATPRGKIKAYGPAEAIARWKPALTQNRAAIIFELRAEHERFGDWWTSIPERGHPGH
jgi:hypothetical protein